MSDTTTIVRAQLKPNHDKFMARALNEIKIIKKARAIWEEDRRLNGWTSANPYCVHGTYIGDPYGADYLCWACEAGYSDYHMALSGASESFRRGLSRYQSEQAWIQVYALALGKKATEGTLTTTEAANHIAAMNESLESMREFEEAWL